MKILFLLPVVSQARYQKRVRSLERLGAKSEILAFERSYYPGKPWPNGYRSLGQLQHGYYIKRLPFLLKAVSIVRASALRSNVIYSFSLDTLLIAWISSRRFNRQLMLVYEVGDIRQTLLGNNITSYFLRWLERFMLQQINILVVTSKAYVTGYFRGLQKVNNLCYQVIENKLDDLSYPVQLSSAKRTQENNCLRIGYFGLIRCRQSWKILKELVKRGNGRISVYIRGIFMEIDDIVKEIQNTAFIEYGGPYVSPDDLPAIYGQVNMVWACYPYQNKNIGNWRWARTNRFYEACFFHKPMFVQLGTEDGRIVTTFGLGVSLDLTNLERAAELILQIKDSEIQHWRKNMKELPKETYILSNEHERLMQGLR